MPARRSGFSRFCARVISPNGYLRHKYNPDGSLASTWHGYVRDGKSVLPIQEDETALVIWAVGEYFELYRRIEETAPVLSRTRHPARRLPAELRGPANRAAAALVRPVGGALGRPHLHRRRGDRGAARGRAGWRTPSARPSARPAISPAPSGCWAGARAVLWNEREQRFARMATPGPSGYALDMTLDASLFGLVLLNALPTDDPQAVATLQQVMDRLWVQTDVGGLARYQNDYYHQVERAGHVARARQPLVRLHDVAGALPSPARPDDGRSGTGAQAARVGRAAGPAVRHHGGAAASVHRRAALGLAAHLEPRGVRARGAGVHRPPLQRQPLPGVRADLARWRTPLGHARVGTHPQRARR